MARRPETQSIASQNPTSARGEVRGGDTRNLRTRFGHLVKGLNDAAREGNWAVARKYYAEVADRNGGLTPDKNTTLLSRFASKPVEAPYFRNGVPDHFKDLQEASNFIFRGATLRALNRSEVRELAVRVGSEGNPTLLDNVDRLLGEFSPEEHGRALVEIIGARTERLLDELQKQGRAEEANERQNFRGALIGVIPNHTKGTVGEQRAVYATIENVLRTIGNNLSTVSKDQLQVVHHALISLAQVHAKSDYDRDVATKLLDIAERRISAPLDAQYKESPIPDSLLRVVLGSKVSDEELHSIYDKGLQHVGLRRLPILSDNAWNINSDYISRFWPENVDQIKPDTTRTYAVGGIIHFDSDGKPYLKVPSQSDHRPAILLYFNGLYETTEQMLKGLEGSQLALAVRIDDVKGDRESGNVYKVSVAPNALVFDRNPSKEVIRNLPNGAVFSIAGEVLPQTDKDERKCRRYLKTSAGRIKINSQYETGDGVTLLFQRNWRKGKVTEIGVDEVKSRYL